MALERSQGPRGALPRRGGFRAARGPLEPCGGNRFGLGPRAPGPPWPRRGGWRHPEGALGGSGRTSAHALERALRLRTKGKCVLGPARLCPVPRAPTFRRSWATAPGDGTQATGSAVPCPRAPDSSQRPQDQTSPRSDTAMETSPPQATPRLCPGRGATQGVLPQVRR